MKELPVELRKLMANRVEVQNQVLLDIIHTSEKTEFGKKYHFDQIHSIEDYRSQVPITEYDDYKDAVERMKDGAEDVLFPGRTASFVVTSGTTGIAKYIPESSLGAEVKSLIGKFRTVEMLRMVPQILQPQHNIFALANASVYGVTNAGIPTGSASGQAAESGAMMEKMTLPRLLLTAKGLSNDANEYLTVLFAIADRNVAALICNNLVQFHRLLHLLNTESEQILEDMKNKTISAELPEELKEPFLKLWQERITKERAEELEAVYNKQGKFTVENLWPGFLAVSCWMSGSVGRCVKEFKNDFPEKTLFIEWGYGASEGKFNIPVTPGKSEGYLSIFGIFFEFLPLGGTKTVLLEETKPEEVYELILTNYSGFYRYNIHDVVRVERDEAGFPLLTFLCKSKDHIEISGKKLYSSDLMKIMETYEDKKGMFFSLVQGRKVEEKLQVIVEVENESADLSDLEEYLRAELKKYDIAFFNVICKEPGYRDSLFTKVLDSGKSVVSTKLPVFTD